jgi:hypothetical protein
MDIAKAYLPNTSPGHLMRIAFVHPCFYDATRMRNVTNFHGSLPPAGVRGKGTHDG